jgi:hypothetical protein
MFVSYSDLLDLSATEITDWHIQLNQSTGISGFNGRIKFMISMMCVN